MNQPQSISMSSSAFQSLKQQAKVIANQKRLRSRKTKVDRKNQIFETLATLHSDKSSLATYSQRLLAFTDR